MRPTADGRRPGTATRRRVDAAGLWCALGYAALAVLARRPGEPELAAFFLLVAWTGLPVAGLYLHVRARGEPFPIGRLFAWAVVFRLCGLAGGPFFEDDFYRYLWDGYRFATTGTPYGAAPEAFFVDPAVPALFQGVLDGRQLSGAADHLRACHAGDLPAGVLAAARERGPAAGHPDRDRSRGGGPAAASGAGAQRPALRLVPAGDQGDRVHGAPGRRGRLPAAGGDRPGRGGRWPAVAVCLGLAAGSKTFGLVLVPLLLARARFRYWLLCGVTLAAVYAPFVLRGGTDLASLQVFAREWEFNSALFGLLAGAVPRFEARLVLGLAFAAFWGWYCWKYWRAGTPGVPRGDWLYGALLAASPVINPWYLLWLLPFATVHPSVWAWTASAAVLLSYITGLNMQDYAMHPYAQPLWARWLEFGLVGAGLVCDGLRRRRARAAGRVEDRRRGDPQCTNG